MRSEDKKYLLYIVLEHYQVIVHCLPKEFLLKCWEFVLDPINMDDRISKALLNLCSTNDFTQFINILKIETVRFYKISFN